MPESASHGGERRPNKCGQQASRWCWPNLYWLALTLAAIVLDQLTKWWAQADLVLYRPHQVLPFFNFTLAYNQGAAFSFLATEGGWQRWFLALLAVVVSAVILVWLLRLRPGEKLQAAGLALVLGGAIGNLIDRLVYGYVVDFLDFHWQFNHFPAFNLADSAITLGAILLILDMFTSKSHD